MDQLIQKAEPIIKKIAESRKVKASFAYYTPEDIFQEIWVLCLEALKNYDESRGNIENFLNVHVSNRIKNLKRDKYFKVTLGKNSKLDMERINLVNALPIDQVEIKEKTEFIGSSNTNINPEDIYCAKELKQYIINNLSPHLVDHFYLLLNGNKIKKKFIDELRIEIKRILSDNE